jgi:pimeloyl-ACP methyl ester carboxylesterase
VEVEAGGIRAYVRSGEGKGVPVLLLHGTPNSGAMWEPFAERLSSPWFAPDLPGYGLSERPPPDRFGYTPTAYADVVDALVDELGLETFDLVLHDWGAVGLISAQRRPERIRRLVAINVVPLGAGYRWHWISRHFWSRGLRGEVAMRTTTKPAMALVLRQSRPGHAAMPRDFVDEVWSHFDRGTREGILRLYRSAPTAVLDELGAGLGSLTCPSLVIWGADDPWVPAVYGRRLAARLPASKWVEVPRAGHWPWIDRPAVADRAAAFLSG